MVSWWIHILLNRHPVLRSSWVLLFLSRSHILMPKCESVIVGFFIFQEKLEMCNCLLISTFHIPWGPSAGWVVTSDALCVLVTRWCLTLCGPMGDSPPGSSIHGIFQARVLEWIAISFSRGSSWPRDWTWVSCIAGKLFTVWSTREAPTSDVPTYYLMWCTWFCLW